MQGPNLVLRVGNIVNIEFKLSSQVKENEIKIRVEIGFEINENNLKFGECKYV